ncbi:MAG: DUF2207 domain-containing protein [Anaerolineae bacterium]|nr:DUF2207 domain-containing protein [Anaerolineae bacterium]
MLSILRTLAVLVVLVGLAVGAHTAYAAKSYSADRFDVAIQVQPDGSALVTETVAFRFEGGPFTFAFRGLPTRYTDGISNIQVREGDRVYTQGGKTAGQYTLDTKNNSIETRWYFEETSDAVRVFTLSYRVAGVVREENGQAALRWGALPPDHDYAIRSSNVTITLPPRANVERAQVLVGTAELQQGDQTVTLTARDIARNRELVGGVWAPLTAFTNVPPTWQVTQSRQAAEDQARLPWGAAVAGLLGLLGLGGLAAAWRRVPALPPVSRDIPMYSLPDQLPPALAATLVKDSNGAGFGTLLDLAKRGVVQIREREGQGVWGKKSIFEFVVRQPNAALAPFEQVILNEAFAKGQQTGVVSLEDLGKGLQSGRSRISEALKAELRQRGLLDPARERIRNQFYIWGGVLLVLGLVIGIPAAILFRVAGVLPMIVLFLIAIVTFILGAAVSVRTAEGERIAAAWAAFQDFLKRIADGRAPDAAQYLEVYLPYAAAFGMEEQWMKRYANAQVGVPGWFSPLSPTNTSASWVAFSGAIHSASSTAGASSAAGAGAAGGGSSGAG